MANRGQSFGATALPEIGSIASEDRIIASEDRIIASEDRIISSGSDRPRIAGIVPHIRALCAAKTAYRP